LDEQDAVHQEVCLVSLASDLFSRFLWILAGYWQPSHCCAPCFCPTWYPPDYAKNLNEKHTRPSRLHRDNGKHPLCLVYASTPNATVIRP
jgi:hypothetical protein